MPYDQYPALWQVAGNAETKTMGDKWMHSKRFPAFKVRSAINRLEYNFLLNPLYPGFDELVKIDAIEHLNIDARPTG